MNAEFLYLLGPPRSGTTFLLDVVDSSTEVGILNEFPIFEYLKKGRVDEFLTHTIKRVEDSSSSSIKGHYNEIAAAIDVIQKNARPDERWVEKIIANALRAAETLAASARKPIKDGVGYSDPMLLARLKYHMIFQIYVLLCGDIHLDIKYFGIKLPGVVSIEDFSWAQEVVGNNIKAISIFRNPLNYCLSSMQRFLDTEAGLDNWHITKPIEAVNEWTRCFYYNKLVRDKIGEDNYLGLFYELFTSDRNFAEISSHLNGACVKRLAFNDIMQTKMASSGMFLDLITELLTKSQIPYGAEWTSLANHRQLLDENFWDLKPQIVHDLSVLHLYDPGCPAVVEGFDCPEEDGVWMISRQAVIRVYVPTQLRRGGVGLCLAAWPQVDFRNSLTVSVNGSPRCRIDIERRQSRLEFSDRTLENGVIWISGDLQEWNTLELEVGRLVNIAGDPRGLAVKLSAILFGNAGAAAAPSELRDTAKEHTTIAALAPST